MDVTDEGDESCCGEQPDPRDGHEPLGNRVMGGEACELAFAIMDSLLESSDLLSGGKKGRCECLRYRVLLAQKSMNGRDETARSNRDRMTELAENATGSIDAGGSFGEPGVSIAVERSDDVLIDRFYWNGMYVLVSECFEDRLGVGSIGFVTGDVGTDGVWWEQDNIVAQAIQSARPVMSAAARLEENRCRQVLGEESLELWAGEAVAFGNASGMV